jgi:uncharacterized phage protein (predicted DNA packaging)
MSYVTLDTVKKHLNICHDEDDEYLSGTVIPAAEDAIARDIKEDLSVYDDGEGNLPASLVYAILCKAHDLYENRGTEAFAASSTVKTTAILSSYFINYKK